MQQSSNTLLTRFRNIVCIALLALFVMPFMVTMANAQSCPPNLISYWKLDEATGFVATDSMDANDGILFNGPVWGAGRVEGALSFDGVDDYVLLPDSPNLSSTSAITLEAWVRPSTVAADRHIISTAGAGPSLFGHDYFFRIDNGDLRFSINNVDLIVNDALPVPDRWYHVVGTYDQAQGMRNVFVDADLLGTDVYTAGINTGHNVVTIGINARTVAFGGILSPFHGVIDEVAIYDRALSLEEIQHHYEDGTNGLGYCPAKFECVGYDAPLNEGLVKVSRRRALPLKAQLLDDNQMAVTDAELASAPVLQVIYSPSSGGDPIDVTDDALAVGLGTAGNQFEFSGDRWRHNLKTSNYTSPGTYALTMVAGDDYVVRPTCEASFAVE